MRTDVKGFVLSYARYRRLGFTEVQALDFAMSKPSVTPITAARAKRVVEPARRLRAELVLVK